MARFRVAALIAVQAAATKAFPTVAARFHAVEPIHAVAAKNALAFVRCGMEPIRAVLADRTGEAIRCVKAADRTGVAIRHAMEPIL